MTDEEAPGSDPPMPGAHIEAAGDPATGPDGPGPATAGPDETAAPGGGARSGPGGGGPPARRPRYRRVIGWGVVALVVCWAAASAVVLVLGLRDASRGAADVATAKAHLSVSEIVSRGPIASLQAAGTAFDGADGLLRSPLLAPLDIVPVVGRQLRAVQDLSSASAQVARLGVHAVTQARAVLNAPHHTGPERIMALQALARLAGGTDQALAHLDLGPSDALISTLAAKRATFVRDVADVRSRLQHASAVASTMAGILQGPQSYLLLMGNNAEMRAGSGNFLQVGVLSTDAGVLHLSDVQASVSIPVPAGKVTASGDLAARWGWLKPGQDWRNLGLTPQFDVNGPLAARMWEAETGQHVDGVLAVDVIALQDLLKVTGPVTIAGGQSFDAGTVVQYLVHDQYAGLTDSPSALQDEAEGARQDRLGTLAKATLDTLQNESLDLRALSDAMTSATQGRHIMLWSAQASAEQAWQLGGVAGELAPNSLMTAVINRGGNKLDQYLSVGVGLRMVPHGHHADGTLTVTLHNDTPSGQSQFIAGPYPGLGATYGEYIGFLALNLPGSSSTPHVEGNPPLDALGAEGPTWLVATPVDVKDGQSETVVVHFTMPEAHGTLDVLPTARLVPVGWGYRGSPHTDAAPFALSW